MKVRWRAALAALAWVATAQAVEPSKSQTAKMGAAKMGTESCSEFIHREAVAPQKASELHMALAEVYEQHAKWVGTATPAAKAEHDELLKISKSERDASTQLNKLYTTMVNVPTLAVTEHNPAKAPPGLAAAHDRVAQISSDLIPVLQNMVRQNREMAQNLRGVGGAGQAVPRSTMPSGQMRDMDQMQEPMTNPRQPMQNPSQGPTEQP